VQASPFFCSRMLSLVASLALLLSAAGCVTVRPEEKEYLAEPAMTWGGEGITEQHEQHIVENREGSTGGSSTSGGGCGCN
jgi:hypothetical protein